MISLEIFYTIVRNQSNGPKVYAIIQIVHHKTFNVQHVIVYNLMFPFKTINKQFSYN